jgi:hypothetical protein
VARQPRSTQTNPTDCVPHVNPSKQALSLISITNRIVPLVPTRHSRYVLPMDSHSTVCAFREATHENASTHITTNLRIGFLRTK